MTPPSRKRQRVSLLVVSLLIVSLLAANCGGDQPASQPPPETIARTTEPPQPQSGATALPNPEAAPLDNPDTVEPLLASPQDSDADVETPSGNSRPPGPGNTFTLGYLLASTGDLAILATPLITAIQMAAAQANAAGYQQVNLLAGNTGSDLIAAQEAAGDLLAQEPDAVIGALTSAVSLAVVDQFIEAQTPLVSPSSTAPVFTDYPDNGFFFRTAPSDRFRGMVLGDLVAAGGGSRVAVVYRDDEYGVSLAEATVERLKDYDIEVVGEFSADPEAETFFDEIVAVRESGADSVVLIAFEEGSLFLQEWIVMAGLTPLEVDFYLAEQLVNLPWGSQTGGSQTGGSQTGGSQTEPDGDDGAVLLDGLFGTSTVQGVAPGSYTLGRDILEELFADFVTSQTFVCPDELSEASCEAAQNLGPFAAEAYDATVVLLLADLQASQPVGLATGGGGDPLSEHIVEVTRGGLKCYSYVDCAGLVVAGRDINYQGVSGSLDLSDDGEPDRGTYRVWEINDLGQTQFSEDMIVVS